MGFLCPLHYVLHCESKLEGDILAMTSFNGLVLARLPASSQLILVWAHVFAASRAPEKAMASLLRGA